MGDIISQESGTLSFIHGSVFSETLFLPDVRNDLLDLGFGISFFVFLSLLGQDFFNLFESFFCNFVIFVASFKITFWIFLFHVIEVVIVSKKSGWWLEEWSVANPASGGTGKHRDS